MASIRHSSSCDCAAGARGDFARLHAPTWYGACLHMYFIPGTMYIWDLLTRSFDIAFLHVLLWDLRTDV